MRKTPAILGPDELEAYRRDGFVVPRYRLPEKDIAKLQALTLKLVQDNPNLTDRHMVGPHVPGSGFEGLKSSPGWMDIATHPDIVDMIEQILGPDIILWGSGVFYKRPQTGTATPWHCDAVHSPIKPNVTTSVWISVWESTLQNGCVEYIPGSHKPRRIGKHIVEQREDLFLPARLDSSEFDATTAVPAELQPGQMVLFDTFTIHGAKANNGPARAGYTLRFMPSTSFYDHAGAEHSNLKGYGHDTRPLILVRGVDRCGKNDFRRGHPKELAAP